MDFNIYTEKPDLNKALFEVTHGLYILTSTAKDKINGQCLDALMQVTNNPPMIAIGVGKKSLTHEMIMESGKFGVNIIDQAGDAWRNLVKLFGMKSGRDINKFENIEYELGDNACPILTYAKAFYECSVVKEKCLDLQTHTLFIGTVNKAGVHENGKALTYNEYRAMVKIKK